MANYSELSSLASQQHGVVSKHQLANCGFTPHQTFHRIKSGQWTRVSPRVISLAGALTTWDQHVSAAGLAVENFGALSHRTAGRIWGFRSVDEQIEVAIPASRRISLGGVIVHRSCDLEPNDVTWVNGRPVTSPERTLCDFGLIFPEHEVERVLHYAISGETPLVKQTGVLSLRRRISEHGRAGAGVIGRCLDQLPEFANEAESGLEVLFLQLCEAHGIPTPARQLPVVIAGRRYRLDFAYPQIKLFIEIDGAHHAGQIAKDGGRQNDLVSAGWRPIRFAAVHLKKSPDWCAEVMAAAITNSQD